MKIEVLPKEFAQALPVLEKIHAAGFEAYFVGGSVRDVLLHKKIHDVDIATSAFPSEIKEIFPRTVDVGIEHGTVLVLAQGTEYEITTFRTESTYQDFRRPDKVEFVRSLKEDLKRRDFTINALAMDVSGNIIDEFHGVEDMKAKIIRAVGSGQERFYEDALRMMRAARFASQLNFTIEEDTFAAMCENAPLLAKISVERIAIEFIKLMQGTNRKRGLMALINSKSYLYLPEINQDDEPALKRLAGLPKDRLFDEGQIWALVCFCLGLKREEILVFLRQWKISNAIARRAQNIVSGFIYRIDNPWNALELYRFSEDEIRLAEEMRKYFLLDSNIDAAIQQHKSLPIHSKQDLAISGKDILAFLDEKPGQWLGEILSFLEVEILKGRLPNEKRAILRKVRELKGAD